MKTANANASAGSVRDSPLSSAILSTAWPRRRMAMMQAKAPEYMKI